MMYLVVTKNWRGQNKETRKGLRHRQSPKEGERESPMRRCEEQESGLPGFGRAREGWQV